MKGNTDDGDVRQLQILGQGQGVGRAQGQGCLSDRTTVDQGKRSGLRCECSMANNTE